MEWSEIVKEKKIWEEDYEARREELDAKWANEKAEEGEGRRLNRTDKERFLEDFSFDVNGRTLHLEQSIANSPASLGLTVWDAVPSPPILSRQLPLCPSSDCGP